MKYICINTHQKFSTMKACEMIFEKGDTLDLDLTSGLYHSSEYGIYYNIMEFKTYYTSLDNLRDIKIDSIIG